MNYRIILALFLAITATLFLTSCRVTKQISKQETSTESANKVDSAYQVKNDIKKETKTISETTETIDTVIQITPKGDIVSDTTKHKGKTISVKVKKKRVIKVASDVLETDKSKTRVEVKKQEKKEETKKEVVKDIEKTGVQWYWWILILLAVLAGLAFKFRKFFGW